MTGEDAVQPDKDRKLERRGENSGELINQARVGKRNERRSKRKDRPQTVGNNAERISKDTGTK